MKKTLLIAIAMITGIFFMNSCTKDISSNDIKTLDMNTITENYEEYKTALLSGKDVIIKAGDNQIKASGLRIDPAITIDGMDFLTNTDEENGVVVWIHKEDKAILVSNSENGIRKDIFSFTKPSNLKDYINKRKIYEESSKSINGYSLNISDNVISNEVNFSVITKQDKVTLGIETPNGVANSCGHDHQNENNFIEEDLITTENNKANYWTPVNRTWTIRGYYDNAHATFWTVVNFTEMMNYIISIRTLNGAFVRNAASVGSFLNHISPYVRLNFTYIRLNTNINNPQSSIATLNAFQQQLQNMNAPRHSNTSHVFMERENWSGIAGLAWTFKVNGRRLCIASQLWERVTAHEVAHTYGCNHLPQWLVPGTNLGGVMAAPGGTPWYMHPTAYNTSRNTLRFSN